MIEPKIGEIFSLHGIKVKTCLMKDGAHCSDCAFAYLNCSNIVCCSGVREDETLVIFKEVKEMEVKIQIPDNCELIKDGDTYIVKEKKQNPPRSWEEFCARYPITGKEAFIDAYSNVRPPSECDTREVLSGKNWCDSKEEAEAFLALMQLRQLRKAWVGDWTPTEGEQYAIVIVATHTNILKSSCGYWDYNRVMSFPTKIMADDFLSCFRDLCEAAKILL